MSVTLATVRRLAAAGHVRVSQHGMPELSQDNIGVIDAIAGVAHAVVVEDYPMYHKGPSVLCLQRDSAGDPLHILWGLAAHNPGIATIITGYRPNPTRWMDDLKTRRPK